MKFDVFYGIQSNQKETKGADICRTVTEITKKLHSVDRFTVYL